MKRTILVSACALLALTSCSQSKKATIPSWSNAQDVSVRAKDAWNLEQGDVKVTATSKRGPKHMQLDLAIESKGPNLRYDQVRAFWDNEEMKPRGVAIGELSTSKKGDGWTAKLTMEVKVHKWPEKDIVFLAVGKAVWKIAVSP